MRRLGTLRRLTLASKSTWKLRPTPSAASIDKMLKRFYGESQLLDALQPRGYVDATLPSGRRFIFPLNLG